MRMNNGTGGIVLMGGDVRAVGQWMTHGVMMMSLLAGPAFAQNLVLTPVLPAQVGAHPEGLTVGDFNEDGRLDVATANRDSDDVSVLLGNGNGTFQSAYSFGVGRSPTCITVGDLNRDGTLDLVVAEAGADRVAVLLGKGDGFFDPPVSYPTGKGPTFLAVADVDRDHDLDLVVVNSGRFGYYPPFSWSVLLNQGSGDFVSAYQFQKPGQDDVFPTSLSLADLNDDGLPEVTLTWSQPSWRTPNGYVSVFQNQGGGAFSLWQTIQAGFTLSAVTQTDVDDDGNLDLIVTSLFTDSVKVLLQQRPGRYTKPADLGVGFSPVAVTYDDLDGDDHLDLISTNRTSNSTSILLGRGDGSFQPAGHYAAGVMPTAMGIEDFDGDGLPDVVTANAGSNDVSILLSGKAVIPSITLSADRLQFSEDFDAPAQRMLHVTVSNVGLGPLHVSNVVLEGPDAHAFSLDQKSCVGATLLTGKLCTLHVHFTSTRPGVHQASVRIFDNAPGGPRVVMLSGTVEGLGKEEGKVGHPLIRGAND